MPTRPRRFLKTSEVFVISRSHGLRGNGMLVRSAYRFATRSVAAVRSHAERGNENKR
jgi:hypothetical protein